MADAPIPAPPARLSRGRAASVVGGRLVLIVALIAAVSLVASVALLPVVVPAGGLARDTVDRLGDVPPLQEALPDPAQRSVIYAADGKTALATIWLDENRRVVGLKDIPHRVRNAVIAIEDDRFFQHEGVDFRGIARAGVTNLRSGAFAQGGSTLTQQLVKLTITGNSRTIDRKLREAMYAVELERRYSKNEILQYYLNQAYFGEGVYGIATAAQHYFGNKSVKFVSLSEAASLAATIAAPERYKPTAKKANVARRNLVLDRMQKLGYASAKDVAKAKKEKLKVERYTPPSRQPYFQAYIIDQLLNDHSYDKALGKVGTDERKRKVFQGGLKIYTTLQGPRQAMAANAVQGQMNQFRGDPAGALASVEPTTGRIVALYGGRSFKKSQVDLATAQGGTGFQPGSAFKMFFVVAALEKGISPGIVLPGPAQITIPNRRCYTGNGPWSPGNAGDSSAGTYNMYGADGQLGEHLVRPARGEGRPRERGRGGPQDGHHQRPTPRLQGVRVLERLLAGAGRPGGVGPGHGRGLRRAGQQGRPLRPLLDHQGGRAGRAQAHHREQARVQAGHRREDLHPDRGHAARGHHQRHRRQGVAGRPAGGRQDRQRPEQHQRLLLRLHPPALHLGLGRLPGQAGADAQPVQRRAGLRRDLPGR